MTHYSHCHFHLGDNLAHLHLLRTLAQANPGVDFEHAVHACHLPALCEAVADVPSIRLTPYEQRRPGALDSWKNAGGYWERHPRRMDYVAFTLEFYRHYARQLGMESPCKTAQDLLFNYPAIRSPFRTVPGFFDVLVVNSQPCSGQFLSYDSPDCLDPLIRFLVEEAKLRVAVTKPCGVPGVYCTQTDGLSLAEIGHLSLTCPYLVMVSTGPSWPTFNVWNTQTVQKRLILLGTETIELAPHTWHARSKEQALDILRDWKSRGELEPRWFAEFGEDRWMAEHLPLPARGVVVDLGCAHPEQYSSTAFLRQRGWRGLAVDAHPGYAEYWLKLPEWEQALCPFLPVVLATEATVRFAFHKNSLCSRLTPPGVPAPPDATVRELAGHPLESVLSVHQIRGIDVLAMDLEGAEYDVFRTMDWARHQPRVIVAEYATAGVGEDFRLRDHLLELGYRVVHQTKANLIFTR